MSQEPVYGVSPLHAAYAAWWRREALWKAYRGNGMTMTEAQWLASTDPWEMLRFLEDKVSKRKLRLFACACSRQNWDLLAAGSRKAVEMAERYADGLVGKAELAVASKEASEVTRQAKSGLQRIAADEAEICSFENTAYVAEYPTRETPGVSLWLQAALLRDIAGNPWIIYQWRNNNESIAERPVGIRRRESNMSGSLLAPLAGWHHSQTGSGHLRRRSFRPHAYPGRCSSGGRSGQRGYPPALPRVGAVSGMWWTLRGRAGLLSALVKLYWLDCFAGAARPGLSRHRPAARQILSFLVSVPYTDSGGSTTNGSS